MTIFQRSINVEITLYQPDFNVVFKLKWSTGFQRWNHVGSTRFQRWNYVDSTKFQRWNYVGVFNIISACKFNLISTLKKYAISILIKRHFARWVASYSVKNLCIYEQTFWNFQHQWSAIWIQEWPFHRTLQLCSQGDHTIL